jgi:hypothetical protein
LKKTILKKSQDSKADIWGDPQPSDPKVHDANACAVRFSAVVSTVVLMIEANNTKREQRPSSGGAIIETQEKKRKNSTLMCFGAWR